MVLSSYFHSCLQSWYDVFFHSSKHLVILPCNRVGLIDPVFPTALVLGMSLSTTYLWLFLFLFAAGWSIFCTGTVVVFQQSFVFPLPALIHILLHILRYQGSLFYSAIPSPCFFCTFQYCLFEFLIALLYTFLSCLMVFAFLPTLVK